MIPRIARQRKRPTERRKAEIILKDPYSILGVHKSATDEEIKSAYNALVRKYHPDNYSDDNPLKELAEEKMQEVNAAYDMIQKLRSKKKTNDNGGSYNGSGSGIYAEIRRILNAQDFGEAERKLFSIPPESRTAEWHYLISVVLMGRGRVNDAMRELEIACDLDPSNVEYQRAKEMFNNTANSFGNTHYENTYYGSVNNQHRNPRRSNYDACNCCMDLICLDCMCELCGGDFISCI